MPSNLYRLALAALSEDERLSLADLESRIEGFTGEPGRPVRGDGVLSNLREEAHLVGDLPYGQCGEMAAFLRRCLEAEYAVACAEHEGRGLPIAPEHLPDSLLRYVRGTRLVRRLVETILGQGALSDLESGTIPLESVFARLAGAWDAARLDEADSLGSGKARMVFATFEHEDGAPREDAGALAQALALPMIPRKEEVLIELTYPRDSVQNHRFPTVADAGWMHQFQPSPEAPPDSSLPRTCCGWTKPLGDQPAQPELVHRNAPVAILSHPPRLVGRFTP